GVEGRSAGRGAGQTRRGSVGRTAHKGPGRCDRQSPAEASDGAPQPTSAQALSAPSRRPAPPAGCARGFAIDFAADPGSVSASSGRGTQLAPTARGRQAVIGRRRAGRGCAVRGSCDTRAAGMVCAGAAIAEPGRSQGRAHLGAAAVGVALAMVAVAAVGLILMGSHSLASLQTLVGGSGHRVSATEPRALPAPAQSAAQRAAARQLSPGVISALSSRIGSSEPAYWPSRRGGELVARGGGIESAFG